MIRSLKLGSALLAVVAMSALGGPVASAAAGTFTASAGAGILVHDTYNLELTSTGQGVKCGSSLFTGNAPSSAFTSITMHAQFLECRTTIGTTATITGFGQHGEPNACDFVFHATGNVDLVCPTGQEVTVDATTCVLHIPGQTGLGTLTYTNNGNHVDVGVNVTTITANHTDGFLCPFGSSGHSTSAVLESSSALTAIPSVGSLRYDS